MAAPAASSATVHTTAARPGDRTRCETIAAIAVGDLTASDAPVSTLIIAGWDFAGLSADA